DRPGPPAGRQIDRPVVAHMVERYALDLGPTAELLTLLGAPADASEQNRSRADADLDLVDLGGMGAGVDRGVGRHRAPLVRHRRHARPRQVALAAGGG